MTSELKDRVELLPCPFCGQEARIKDYAYGGAIVITCDKCRITQGGWLNKQNAINQWNTRPREGDITEREEKLIACVKLYAAIFESNKAKATLTELGI